MGRYDLWLRKYEEKKKLILEEIQTYRLELKRVIEQLKEKNLFTKIDEKRKIDATICFIDGGDAIKELLGASIYLIKASALVLEKRSDKLSNERFLRDLDFGVLEYEENNKERVELLRCLMEFQLGRDCIKKFNPDFLLMDGSLYVNANKRYSQPKLVIKHRALFNSLLKEAEKNGTKLIGVSEDSRSRVLVNYLTNRYNLKIPRFITDSTLIKITAKDNICKSITFKPLADGSEKDYEFQTFYLQPTPLANPLRIDVPDLGYDIEEIASLVYNLSLGSRSYGYPIGLHLAHLDAKVEAFEMEWCTKQLAKVLEQDELFSVMLRKTRRELRPKIRYEK
ncbi:MAG TPA: DNA double-strand break repair nuclease NurA [Candidatus Altiarchaeales archaeon]|nr:MAG: hypothetical protein DRO65_00765 [Candidatus Altiarchaeales archaeon]HDN83362.1 DNA double-strand break repair nuclease NurA [Candidatus Altiarchaeales archaeon]